PAPRAFFLSLSCTMWPPKNHAETGKRWVQNAFERISTELRDPVVIVYCGWQENDPEYRFCFQITGHDEEALSFTRGTLKSCGKGGHSAVRQKIEAAIRDRLTRMTTNAG